ncbi:hypothetical protein CLOP_g17293, partial [Closterium sp. NIES-67]
LQRQKFTYRRKGDVGSTREVIASPARSVNPFNWNFPRLVRNEQERLVPARGFSHGGPRQGTEYEAMARQAGHILGSSGEPMQASTAPLEERTGGPGMCPHVSAHAENMQQEDGVAGVGRAVEQRGGGAVEDVLAGAGAPLVSDGPTRDRPATVRDGTPRRGARGRGRGKALEGWPEMRTLDRVPAGTCYHLREFWNSEREKAVLTATRRGPKSASSKPKWAAAFALAGIGFQQMWEVSRTLGIKPIGKSTYRQYMQGSTGLWGVVESQATRSMEMARAAMLPDADGGVWIAVDGRWSHPREANWCTISFLHPATRKVIHEVTVNRRTMGLAAGCGRRGCWIKSQVREENIYESGVE